MRTNYVLIDYENVQPENLSPLKQAMFKVMVFVGANQTKLTREIVFAMQAMGGKGEYIEIAGNGPNALDFHIAYYIGKLSAADPSAAFHIISRDSGFDPLIKHLKDKKLIVDRVKRIEDIPELKAIAPKPAEPKTSPTPTKTTMVKVANAKTQKERLALIEGKLLGPSATKPKTIKTLSSHISSLFLRGLTDSEITQLIEGLKEAEVITIENNKVAYGK